MSLTRPEANHPFDGPEGGHGSDQVGRGGLPEGGEVGATGEGCLEHQDDAEEKDEGSDEEELSRFHAHVEEEEGNGDFAGR